MVSSVQLHAAAIRLVMHTDGPDETTRLRQPKAIAMDVSAERYRLLIMSVTDYAIYMLDLEGQSDELERWRGTPLRLYRG